MTHTRPPAFSTSALVVTALAVLTVVLFGHLPAHGRWASDLANAAHGPAFAVVTVILIVLLRRLRSGRSKGSGDYGLAVAAAMLIGAMVELAQFAIGRDAAVDDLIRDALGALAAAGFYAARDPRLQASISSSSMRTTAIVLGALCTAAVFAPLTVTAAAYIQRNRAFPTLVDFGSPISTYFVEAYDGVTIARKPLPAVLSGGSGANVGLHAALEGVRPWSIALWEPCPDWRGYERIAIEIANPDGARLRLQLRLRDHHPDFGRLTGDLGIVEVSPLSHETVFVPLPSPSAASGDAPVDLAEVRALVLMGGTGNQALEFYVTRVWLQ